MEWKLRVYPVLAVVLGLLLIGSVDVLIPRSQIFTMQSDDNQTKAFTGRYPSEAQNAQSTEVNLSPVGVVASFEMLAIGLVFAILVYYVTRSRFS